MTDTKKRRITLLHRISLLCLLTAGILGILGDDLSRVIGWMCLAMAASWRLGQIEDEDDPPEEYI